ncbi:MAG: hypothetical protein HYZ50_16500 [Deltaproteobacteria bacterium]|nr:hypothetical protein [Deltaproteobacteria bacterium]
MNTALHKPGNDTPLNADHRGVLPSVRKEEGVHCPICLLPTGRRIRGKIYCGNCGFIES